MATTTLKTWSEGPEDDQNGLEIGGIRITYAELEDIRDREIALDRGITEDLLDMWQNQGGSDYSQLVDWLHRYEAEQHEEREINRTIPHAFAGISDDESSSGHTRKASSEMTPLKLTLWSEGRDPSECGVQINATRLSFEDLDEITSRQEAEAAGVPTVLLDEYHGDWNLFGIWLEDQAN